MSFAIWPGVQDAYPTLPLMLTKLFFLTFCTLYLGHSLGCCWYFIGRVEWCDEVDDSCTPTWLSSQSPPLLPPKDGQTWEERYRPPDSHAS